MQYVKLFIFEILLGYILQSVGSMICLYAFSGKKIEIRQFTFLTLVNAVAVYAIRHINNITFGIHTLLIMLVIILLGISVVRASINASALSALITMVTITVGEVVNYLILNLMYDDETLHLILKDDTTMNGKISKAIAVIPSNVFFIIIMLIIFKQSRKKSKDKEIGKISETNS
ncbi:MAG: hypothetical protein GX303_00550 [Clostridiales bacterium]|nr:hypothetical protein [Clostridiales bacterium]